MTIVDTISQLEKELECDSRVIIEVKIVESNYPLKKAYELSFVSLEHFLAFEVTLKLSDGSERVAEVVPLLGYSSESPEYILDYLKDKARKLQGHTLSKARALVTPDVEKTPFSTTALLTAIDSFFIESLETQPDTSFCIPTSSKKIHDTISIIEGLERRETIKLKLSGNYDLDSSAIKALESDTRNLQHRYRLDANQAYKLDDAYRFFSFLGKSELLSQIDYVEQPLAAGNWDGHGQILKDFPDIPIMLDESIVTNAEVVRAHDMGIPFIKLKLFKQGGILELLKTTRLANELGMGVILGNGVATQTSNKVEIDLFHRFSKLYQAPLEANGFLKISTVQF